jgi:uncharacterized membrane protein
VSAAAEPLPGGARAVRTCRGFRLAAGLAALTVLLEVAYPLVHGRTRDRLTIAAVLAFFSASATHAVASRGARWAGLLVTSAAGTGLLVEAVGTHSGLPFGHYSYNDSLGVRLLGVPLIIPLAWAMMAYPALLVGLRIARRRPFRALAAGAALASWDLFLDPQMVAAGHWRWADPDPHLPGVPDVPLSNYVAWLVVSVLLMAGLDRLPAGRSTADGVPAVLYLWTYGSSVVANVAFFGRPYVALWGGLGMGAVILARWRPL